jgi:hypothetical protein
MWARFTGTNVEFTNIGGGPITGTRTGFTSHSTPAVNDIVIVYVDPTTYEFTIKWYDSTASYALKSTGTYLVHGGASMRNNFLSSEILPVWSQYYRGSTRAIRILSDRDLYAIDPAMIPTGNIGYIH